MRLFAGSRTFAPPPWVPIQISPLRASKIVMMPGALTLRGSPARAAIDSSCPSGELAKSALARSDP